MKGSEVEAARAVPATARYKVEYGSWLNVKGYLSNFWRAESRLHYWDDEAQRWVCFRKITVKDEWKWTGRISMRKQTRKALRQKRYADSGKVPRKERTRVKYYS